MLGVLSSQAGRIQRTGVLLGSSRAGSPSLSAGEEKKKKAVKQDRMEERSDTRGETQNFTFTQERGWKKVSMRSSEQFQVGIMHNHIK